jgi:hypothetical protein
MVSFVLRQDQCFFLEVLHSFFSSAFLHLINDSSFFSFQVIISHVSAREKNDKKLFAFAFVRLMEPGGATLQDGPHELYIYKCEERAKLDSLSYLSLPSSAREPSASGKSKSTK